MKVDELYAYVRAQPREVGVAAVAAHFGVTQKAVIDAAEDYSGPGYMGLVVAYRTWRGVCSLPRSDWRVEAY
jgi:hypothetical protein